MSTPVESGHKSHLIHPCDHLLCLVIRQDGEPGLFVADGVSAEKAAQLLEMMADAVRTDPRFSSRG